MLRQEEIKKLIINHNRRLQALKERKALFGLDTPLAVLTEIEEIGAELEKLQAELNEPDSNTVNLEKLYSKSNVILSSILPVSALFTLYKIFI